MADTKLTKDEKQTLNSYNKYGRAWARAHMDYDSWKKELRRFKDYLPKGKVLEVGSGGGRDTKKLIELGYEYLGTDVSEGLLKAAQENNSGAKFMLKSVYDLDFPNNTFDGFWACAVLLHIPKSRIDEALKELHKVTKPKGVGFISVKKGRGERFIIEPPPDGKRLFSFYSLKGFEKRLLNNGFEILHSEERKKTAKTTWLVYFVRPLK